MCSGRWTAPAPERTQCLPDGSPSRRTDPHLRMSLPLLLLRTRPPQAHLCPPRPRHASPLGHRQMNRRPLPRRFHPALPSPRWTRPPPSYSGRLLPMNQRRLCHPTSPPVIYRPSALMRRPWMRRCYSSQSTVPHLRPPALCPRSQPNGGTALE